MFALLLVLALVLLLVLTFSPSLSLTGYKNKFKVCIDQPYSYTKMTAWNATVHIYKDPCCALLMQSLWLILE